MPNAVILLRKEPPYRRAAVECGLLRLGYSLADRLAGARPTGPDDLLVLWNLKAGLDEDQAMLWEQRGGTVVVMENGYAARTEKTHYAISTHGHNGSGWFPMVGGDDRFAKLGLPIKDEVRRPGGEVLVCGQRGVGSRLMRSPPEWAQATARRFGGRVRPHPGNFAPKVPLSADMALARAVVIWSSACGVWAMLEGLPVIYAAPHWICEDAATPMQWVADAKAVEPPYFATREDALQRMAHGQWHHEEIATGEPFARMKAENWGPRWT